MVKDKLAENFLHELAKNPGSTIKMAVDRVTPESPPHFKRFYVFFKALKRGWKEGCRPILDLRMEDGFGYTIISDQQK
ncbi:hypothetical protein Gotur_035403, partial [Gossypium turneri]